MTDKTKKILSIVLTAIVAVAAVFGINILADACVSSGSIDWNTSVDRNSSVYLDKE